MYSRRPRRCVASTPSGAGNLAGGEGSRCHQEAGGRRSEARQLHEIAGSGLHAVRRGEFEEGLSETAIRDGYTRFKAEKNAKELAAIAAKHSLATAALQTFVDGILDRMIFYGEQLSDLMAPLDLGWKARSQAELALMADLYPLLTKRAAGREISGLSAYEQ